jgi:hypothetical protein
MDDYSKGRDRGGEPKASHRGDPKHSGYGTDRIGGMGGQREFTAGVRELEAQGKELHHCTDGGPLQQRGLNHEDHVKGHEKGYYARKGR